MAQEQPIKALCTVLRGGKTAGMFIADVVFIEGVPHAVFEWQPQPDGTELPIHTVALNPRYFHQTPGLGQETHLYEMPVTDPRQLA